MKLFCRRSSLLANYFLIAPLALLLASSTVNAITIQIDYTYDTFFGSGTAERDRLEEATGFFENLLTDDLSAITPTGTWSPLVPEAWQVTFTNPSDGSAETVNDLVVPADTIILYVGEQTFSGNKLAEAGFGGYNIFSFPASAFDTAVKTRGESGVGTTDTAPWGGYLSIDSDTTWDTSAAGNGSDQHLYSVLLHEVGHVLGIGTAASWTSQINGSGEFTGTESVAEHGGNVALNGGVNDHWAEDTTSNIYNTATSQEAAMDPDILAGDVKLFTDLDVAALDDIGWDIAPPIPEPSGLSLVGISLLVLLQRRRRRA